MLIVKPLVLEYIIDPCRDRSEKMTACRLNLVNHFFLLSRNWKLVLFNFKLFQHEQHVKKRKAFVKLLIQVSHGIAFRI